jgi:hypothetical protein
LIPWALERVSGINGYIELTEMADYDYC